MMKALKSVLKSELKSELKSVLASVLMLGVIAGFTSRALANSNDNSKLQSIRTFLNGIPGTLQMTGTAGCISIQLQRVDGSSDEYFEILSVDFGPGVGGSFLYSPDMHLDKWGVCSVTTNELSCKYSQRVDQGNPIWGTKVTTTYDIKKDILGHVAEFRFDQDQLPAIHVNCTAGR